MLDSGRDGGDEVERVEVEVVAENLGELLSSEESLVLVPEESVSQLLT